MQTSRMVAAVVLATLVGCSGSSPSTTTASTPKPSSSSKPKTVTPNPDVTVAPPRDGHALRWKESKPAGGVSVKVSDSALTWTPDPPDVSITLEVPDTSLGARFKTLAIDYTVSGAATKVPTQTLPLPLQIVQPGAPTVVAAPIGTSVLKSVIQVPSPPPLVVASVRFLDEAGAAIQSEQGGDLVVQVNIAVQ